MSSIADAKQLAGRFVRPGDRVIAFEAGTGFRHLLVADANGARKHKGLGIVDPGKWVGSPWGARTGARSVPRPSVAPGPGTHP